MILIQSFRNTTQGRAAFIILGVLLLAMVAGVPCAEAFDHIVNELCAPENSIKAGNGRIFVTSQQGMFKVEPDIGSVEWTKTKISNEDLNCYFMGMTEMDGYIYTVCTEDSNSAAATIHLFALDPNTLVMTEIANSDDNAELDKVDMPNGLTADGNHNLFLADSGPTLFPGSLWRIEVNGKNIVSEDKIFNEHNFWDCKVNGVRCHNKQLYLSINPTTYVGLSRLLRYDLLNRPNSRNRLVNWDTRHVVYSSYNFIDDFSLIRNTVDQEDGFLVAEYMGVRVIQINEEGDIRHAVTMTMPTSVRLIDDDLLMITDWVSTQWDFNSCPGAAYIWDSGWGVVPR